MSHESLWTAHRASQSFSSIPVHSTFMTWVQPTSIIGSATYTVIKVTYHFWQSWCQGLARATLLGPLLRADQLTRYRPRALHIHNSIIGITLYIIPCIIQNDTNLRQYKRQEVVSRMWNRKWLQHKSYHTNTGYPCQDRTSHRINFVLQIDVGMYINHRP